MRKVFVIVLFCLLLASVSYGAPGVSLTSSASTWETGSVSCSSTTATLALAAAPTRLAFRIVDPNTSYSVWGSSWPATSTSQCVEIKSGLPLEQKINPYLGAIYILTQPGQAAISISYEQTLR
jgi:hypothetical protein